MSAPALEMETVPGLTVVRAPLTATTLVKMTGNDRMPYHGGSGQWPEPGTWREVKGHIVACEHGLHVTFLRNAFQWCAPEMWRVEVSGPRVRHQEKVVVGRARLVERVETWNVLTWRLFMCDCAERMLERLEQAYADEVALVRPLVVLARRRAFDLVTGAVLHNAAIHVREALPFVFMGPVDYLRGIAADFADRSAYNGAMNLQLRSILLTRHLPGSSDSGLPVGRRGAERETAWQMKSLLAYLNGDIDLDAMRASLSDAPVVPS